jgi:hypothetical protein
MQLMNELLSFRALVTEGQVPFELTSVLNRVIDTNTTIDSVAVVTIATLCQAVKDRNLTLLANFTAAAPGVELVQHVRSMSREDIAKLASELLKALEAIVADEESKAQRREADPIEWVNTLMKAHKAQD